MKREQTERRKRDLEVILVLAVVCILLYYVFGKSWGVHLCFALLVSALLFKGSVSRLADGWYGLSRGVSWLNNRIVLSLVFYAFLTPIALLYRLFSNDRLHLKRDLQSRSYFRDRNHRFTGEDFRKLW